MFTKTKKILCYLERDSYLRGFFRFSYWEGLFEYINRYRINSSNKIIEKGENGLVRKIKEFFYYRINKNGKAEAEEFKVNLLLRILNATAAQYVGQDKVGNPYVNFTTSSFLDRDYINPVLTYRSIIALGIAMEELSRHKEDIIIIMGKKHIEDIKDFTKYDKVNLNGL